MAYNSVAGAFYTFYWGCGSAVGPDEVQRFDTMIAGGTEVTKPLQTFQLTSKTAHLNGTLFDVAGRSIQHAAFANKVGAVGGRVYLVKNSNGKVTKQLFTKN